MVAASIDARFAQGVFCQGLVNDDGGLGVGVGGVRGKEEVRVFAWVVFADYAGGDDALVFGEDFPLGGLAGVSVEKAFCCDGDRLGERSGCVGGGCVGCGIGLLLYLLFRKQASEFCDCGIFFLADGGGACSGS